MIVGASVLKLAFEASLFRHLGGDDSSDLTRTARLLTGELRGDRGPYRDWIRPQHVGALHREAAIRIHGNSP